MFRPIIFTEFLFFGAICYLIGSINFAIIITRKCIGKDIRKFGSGNAGMTNVMRSAGLVPGILTFLGDLGKAVVSVAIGKYLLTGMLVAAAPAAVETVALAPAYGAYFCGVCCFFGHIFPVFFNFKGGKGVATGVGTILLIDWRIFIILLLIFGIVLLITRIVSLSSIIATSIYPIATFFTYYFGHILPQNLLDAQNSSYQPFGIPLTAFATITSLILAVTIIIKHADNIKRIIAGKEKKLEIKKG